MSAIAGTFSDIKTIKSRSVVQLCIEVPIERADEALSILGGVPQPGRERWVGIAPIDPERATPHPTYGKPSAASVAAASPSAAGNPAGAARERKLSEQAWWLCYKDAAFQDWMMRATGRRQWNPDENRGDATNYRLLTLLEVGRKQQIDTDEIAARAFLSLKEKFERQVGRISA